MPDNMVVHKHAKFGFKNESKDKNVFIHIFISNLSLGIFVAFNYGIKLSDGIKILWSLILYPTTRVKA